MLRPLGTNVTSLWGSKGLTISQSINQLTAATSNIKGNTHLRFGASSDVSPIPSEFSTNTTRTTQTP